MLGKIYGRFIVEGLNATKHIANDFIQTECYFMQKGVRSR